jgi:hypothetical protein
MKRAPKVNNAIIDQDMYYVSSQGHRICHAYCPNCEFEGDAFQVMRHLERQVSAPSSNGAVDGPACDDEACAGSGYRAAFGAHLARPGN